MTAKRLAIVAFLTLLGAPHAFAQMCQEPTGYGTVACDNRYRDTTVTCDMIQGANPATVGTRASCPAMSMRMLDTPLRSYIDSYNPFLFAYPRDVTNPELPYAGTFSIGTPGDASKTFEMIGNTPKGTSRLAACTTQLKLPQNPANPYDDAVLTRLQLDNCTNQYILNSSLYPYQKENAKQLSVEDPNDPSALISPKTHCQPLRTFTADNEYMVSDYLQVAWQKLLVDPNYRKTTPSLLKCKPCILGQYLPCDREPHLPCGTTLDNPLSPPSPFPEVRASSNSAVPYEEIVDPTHPFSPRWDYLVTDRDYSDPGINALGNIQKLGKAVGIYAMLYTYTAPFSIKNSVYCAGAKKKSLLSRIAQYANYAGKLADLASEKMGDVLSGNISLSDLGLDALSKMTGMDLKDFSGMSIGSVDFLNTLAEKGQTAVMDAVKNSSIMQQAEKMGIKIDDLPGSFSQLGDKLEALQQKAENFDMSKLDLTAKASDAIETAVMKASYKGVSVSDVVGMKDKMAAQGYDITSIQGMQDTFAKAQENVGKMFGQVSVEKLKDLQGLTKMNPADLTPDQAKNLGLYRKALSVAGINEGQVGGAFKVFDAAGDIQSGKAALALGDALNKVQAAATNAGNALEGATANLDKAMGNLKTYMANGGDTGVLSKASDTLSAMTKGGISYSDMQGAVKSLSDVADGKSMSDVVKSVTEIKNAGVLGSITGAAGSAAGAASGIGGAISSAIPGLGGGSSSSSSSSSSGADSSSGGASAATPDTSPKGGNNDPVLPVDVLEFRRPAFEDALQRRVTYNAMCFYDTDLTGGLLWRPGFSALIQNAWTSYCYQWRPAPPPALVASRRVNCWQCFGLRGPITDASSPPCSTNYQSKDKSMNLFKMMLPGAFNLFRREAQCNWPLTPRDEKYNIQNVCRELRKPFTMINKLKMRYYNPSDPKNNALKGGVMEGLYFKDYFGNHMPYPRMWETGTSLQRSPGGDTNTQLPFDTTGQYTAIVGVGREAMPDAASGNLKDANGVKLKDKYTDQRCKTGGWRSSTSDSITQLLPFSSSGIKIYLPDPVTSWTELKLYQARTARSTGLVCLGRYEKVFKPGSAENMILTATAANWPKISLSKCKRGPGGSAQDCEFMSLADYMNAGTPTSDNNTVYLKQQDPTLWPNGWRGYMASEDLSSQFPNFGGMTSALDTGLNNARRGDVIMMPDGSGGAMGGDMPGLPKVALVTEVSAPGSDECDNKKNCYVKVLEPDNGKWPDVCGTTDTWGEMKARYYYKPGSLPKDAQEEYKSIGSPSDCAETRILKCEQKAWDNLSVYHMKDDVRTGCNKERSADCKLQ